MWVGGKRHAPTALPPGKICGTHCTAGWVFGAHWKFYSKPADMLQLKYLFNFQRLHLHNQAYSMSGFYNDIIKAAVLITLDYESATVVCGINYILNYVARSVHKVKLFMKHQDTSGMFSFTKAILIRMTDVIGEMTAKRWDKSDEFLFFFW